MENVNNFELMESISPDHTKQTWRNKEDNYSQVVFYWENNSKKGSEQDPSAGYLLEIFFPKETKEIVFPECTFSGIAISIKLDLKDVTIDELGKVTFGNKNILLSSKVIKGLLGNNLISGTQLACLTTGCGTCKAIA